MSDMPSNEIVYSVGEFVAYANQTLEYAYPHVTIVGELANYRVSKNQWIYFDLKDDEASVRFFGSIYAVHQQLEDGMLLRVQGALRLHPQFGFNIVVQAIELVGEGTINRAQQLLQRRLEAEGLFQRDRKRALPHPPQRIGLVTSVGSAAYADFTKIIAERWTGLDIVVADVHVQGTEAPRQIVSAIERLNQQPTSPDVLVVIRGGGSADDLQAFSNETVVRAVAASRIPTLVAIGHESDTSLAELAADVRGSTPSHAAELLTPDKHHVVSFLAKQQEQLGDRLCEIMHTQQEQMSHQATRLYDGLQARIESAHRLIAQQERLLEAYNPRRVLQRGYALVRKNHQLMRGDAYVVVDDIVDIEMDQVRLKTRVVEIERINHGARKDI